MKLLTAFGFAAILAFALVAAACGGSSTAPTINPPTITETFTGTLDVQGSVNHTFVLTKTGEIDIAITSETVVVNGAATSVTVNLGLDLGVWNGTSCGAAWTYPAVKTGFTTAQAASTPATFCIRMYDVGNVTTGSPVTYSVTVAHP